MKVRVFSADGGGYLGLATASFIAETERFYGVKYTDRFDLFCGTSTGAIIALALAVGLTGTEIVDLYQRLGREVFRNWFPGMRYARYVKGLVTAMYSNKNLKKALDEAFGETTVGDLIKRDKKVLVTAFSVSDGRPRIFKTDHSSDLGTDNGFLLRDIALASAAAPFYFPVVRLQSPADKSWRNYCDGGVFANHPALLGFAEAASHLGVSSENVSILSLSTPRSDIGQPDASLSLLARIVLSRGLIFWRTKPFNIMIDGTSEISHQMLRRFVDWSVPEDQSRYQRITFSKPKGVEMDIANARATRTLQEIGASRAQDGSIRRKIGPFFS